MANTARFREEEDTIVSSYVTPFVRTTSAVEGSSGQIDAYLQEVRHEAHLQLDAGRAEALVAEVVTHLSDGVNARIHDGISQRQAEKDALSGFDNARKFVHKVANSAYETRWTRPLRNGTFLVGAIFLSICSFFPLFGLFGWNDHRLGQVMNVFAISGILSLLIGSFLGRRLQWRRYALLAALLVGISGFAAGYEAVIVFMENPKNPVWVERTELKRRNKAFVLQMNDTKRDIALLEMGLKTYGTPNQPIPVELRQGNAFIVPLKFTSNNQYAFRPLVESYWEQAANPNQERYVQSIRAKQPFLTVSTPSAASERWNRDGGKWLKSQREFLRSYEQSIEAHNIVATNPYFFNWHNAYELIFMRFLFLLIPVFAFFHLVFAYLGRSACRIFNQWVWRLRRTTT